MYSLEIEEEVFKAFKKLTKKDRKHLEAINKKIEQILSDTLQFKPLKHPLDGLMTPTETTGILAPLEAMKTAFLAIAWQPDIEGKYIVYASFAGSQSYWSSQDVTSFVVDAAAPTPAQTQARGESAADMYFVPAVAGIIVTIIVVGVVLLLALRKRP